MSPGKGESVLVHIGTNNVESEETTVTLRKYRQLIRALKQTRVDQIMVSGILPVKGHKGQGYRNCRRIAFNMLVLQTFREKEVGFVDFWGCFLGMTDMYKKDGLHLSRNDADVLANELSAAVDLVVDGLLLVIGKWV